MSLILLWSLEPVSAVATEQSADQEIGTKKAQAMAAERNHDKNAIRLWNEIAHSEIEGGLTSEGLEDERHAIQLYSSDNLEEEYGPLGYSDSLVIDDLIQNGHATEAEKLLVAAVERTKTVVGAKPAFLEAQIESQIADLVVFYVNQKNYDAALRALDQLLEHDLSTGPTPSQAVICRLVRSRLRPHNSVAVLQMIIFAIQKVDRTEHAFPITAIEKIVKAQEACLTSDDERLVETLGSLADAYFQAKRYKEADSYYSRAYEIAQQYHPDSRIAVNECGQNFLANLREIGRSTEADRLSKLK